MVHLFSYSFGQQDSSWSVMVLQKNKSPELKENMVEYSQTGFFLYRNCFYDLEFKNGERKTLRLMNIKQDTLEFTQVSQKKDHDSLASSTAISVIDYRDIKKIILVRDWSSGVGKKLNCDDYYFIFSKSEIKYKLDSKYDQVFPEPKLYELIPRLTGHGITYNFEFGGKLYYHSGITPKVPGYTDEQKERTMKKFLTLLDIIVNKRVVIPVKKND
jgi:hypothetical protein